MNNSTKYQKVKIDKYDNIIMFNIAKIKGYNMYVSNKNDKNEQKHYNNVVNVLAKFKPLWYSVSSST